MATPELTQAEFNRLQSLWRRKSFSGGSRRVFIFNPERNKARDDCCGSISGIPFTIIDTTGRFGDQEPWGAIDGATDQIDAAYCVASLQDLNDAFMFRAAINDLRERHGIKHVTGITTCLPCDRGDKGFILPDGRVKIKTLRQMMKDLSGPLDHLYTIQTHGPETVRQGLACDLSVVSISPWEQMLAYMRLDGYNFTSDRWRVLRPDEGSSSMERHVQNALGLRHVWLNKHRDPVTNEVTIDRLTPRQIPLVRGMNFIAGDDIAGSLETLDVDSRCLADAGAEKVVAFCVHAKLTGNWQQRLAGNPVLAAIYYGDTTVPKGDPALSDKLHRVPLGAVVERIIALDVMGRDPFTTPEIRRMHHLYDGLQVHRR